jgi:hypothetical protein
MVLWSAALARLPALLLSMTGVMIRRALLAVPGLVEVILGRPLGAAPLEWPAPGATLPSAIVVVSLVAVVCDPLALDSGRRWERTPCRPIFVSGF